MCTVYACNFLSSVLFAVNFTALYMCTFLKPIFNFPVYIVILVFYFNVRDKASHSAEDEGVILVN